jgi:phage terminase Nu1 subunit (DNA packaging protein)
MMKVKAVGIEEICRLLAGTGNPPLARFTVSSFVRDGMPKAARGQYDPIACVHWYIGRLRTANQKRSSEGPDGLSIDEAERRLKRAKAESEEMTLAERRRELIPMDEHQHMRSTLVRVTRQRFASVPTRLAPKLQGCTSIEIKALLNASLKDALSDLARRKAS